MNCMTYVKQMKSIPVASAARRRTGERGQTLLEFALLAPFMVLLAVGVVELGRAIYYTIEVNNAASAGAEFAAQDAITASDDNVINVKDVAVCDANGGSPPACRSGVLTAGNVTVVHGCVCDNGAGTSCNPMPLAGSCAGISCANQTAECVQVLTTATFPPLFNYPGLPTSYTANGKAIMRVRK